MTLIQNDSDTPQQKAIKSAMRMNLQNRYTGAVELLLSKAAFLDPRIKNLSYILETQRDELIKMIYDEAEAVIEEREAEILDCTDSEKYDKQAKPPPSKKSKGEHNLLEFLDDVISPEDQDVTITAYQKARSEVKRYYEAALTKEETDEGPLAWWKYNAVRYPVLSKLAKKYLAIPATSVPSERAFSLGGHIANVKRACLQPASVNMLIFLAENLQ